MKKNIAYVITMLVLASCSAPKYTYHFDHYDYNSGKKKAASQEAMVSSNTVTTDAVGVIDESTLVASAKEDETTYLAEPAPAITKEEAVARIKSMTKEERKELKKEIKKYVKESKKEESLKGEGSRKLENDVKLAAIFGAVGIVLLIIGGDVLYVLGAIALIVGLYFFIRWLVRQ
jgi:hypothetical protein